MIRYQIRNKTTGELYDFVVPDEAAGAAQIAANLRSYGPEADREMTVTDISADIVQAARNAAVAAVQKRLDAHAQAWGYDSILSAVSYLASTIPQFTAEATALRDWRDATWVVVAQVQSSVSTQAELFALLPDPPARPQV